LIFLELAARRRGSTARRFRVSRLHAQYSVDNFNFKHHKSRIEIKNRVLRMLAIT
jgi:hypothetical protein